MGHLAAWHGPDPSSTLRVFVVVVGCLCLTDYSRQYLKQSHGDLSKLPLSLQAFAALEFWPRLGLVSMVLLILTASFALVGHWLACKRLAKAVSVLGPLGGALGGVLCVVG